MIAIVITRHQRVSKKKIYFSNVEQTLLHQKFRFCSVVYYEKQFSKNMFMSIRPIPVQTKVQLKILQLLVVVFDMKRLHLAIHIIFFISCV